MMPQGGSLYMLYGCASSVLICMGIYALALHAHFYRRILAWNVLGSGIFLFLGSIGKRNVANGLSDPLPQALVITGIVVSVSATALALALARRVQAPTEEDRK